MNADPPPDDAGFTLVEVLVAFIITALSLSVILTAVGLSSRSQRLVEARTRASLAAQSELDRIIAGRLVLGEKRWQGPDGNSYVVAVQPMSRRSTRADVTLQPVTVALTVRGADGALLVTLNSVGFAEAQP